MIKRMIMVFIIIVAFTNQGFPQRPGRGQFNFQGGTITGYVFDAVLDTSIEYANIVLFNQRDSSQVTGTITDKNGFFTLTNVRPGRFYMKVSFIGYETQLIPNIGLRPNNPKVSAGEIGLKQSVLSSDGVEVTAERAAMEYHIDKKVINVSQQTTTISGTAVEVLENVPSVVVDIEGNVSLRGSENFTVLIDGRPTVLESSDALQQIPASAIENIEIITNPSARFDPDGNTGIVNVVMKKNQGATRTGIVNVNVGVNEKYGGDFLLSNRFGKFNLTIGADYDRRVYTGSVIEERQTIRNGLTSFINRDGDSDRHRERYGFRSSLDADITENDKLSLGLRMGYRDGRRDESVDYDTWAEPDLVHALYTSENEGGRSGNFYSGYLDYTHDFPGDNHELNTQITFSQSDGEEASTNEQRDVNNVVTSGNKTTEEGPGDRFRIRMDYKRPLGEKSSIETGYQKRLNESVDETSLQTYDPQSLEYVFQPDFSHTVDYVRDIQSLYAMYRNEYGNWGFQTGLRGEYTWRKVTLNETNETFSIDRWDYFPTFHTSLKLPNKQQTMFSYTRRIHRPRGWYLEPFETWSDAYNVRKGNPDIEPEYIDAYEAGYSKYFGRNMISGEVYYRVTHNKVERVRSVYDVDVTLHSIANVGEDYSLGAEFMFNYDLFKWWNTNLMATVYNYRIEGSFMNDDFSRESNNWRLRLNSAFKPASMTRIQINLMYNSGSVSAQGSREGHLRTNFALRQEFLDRKLSVVAQVQDLFQTSKYESTSEGEDFYIYSKFTREAPIYMLTLSYNINNYKRERQQNGQENGMDMEENGEEF